MADMASAAEVMGGFPSDLPPPWFGFALLSYWVGGGASVLIGLLMVAIFSFRRRLLAVHTLPLFAGLVVYFLANGAAQMCRAWIINHALLDHGGMPDWDTVQYARVWLVMVRAIAAVWIVAATVEAIPWMTRWNGRHDPKE